MSQKLEFLVKPTWTTNYDTSTDQYCVKSPNTKKYGPEKTPYLVTFHAVQDNLTIKQICNLVSQSNCKNQGKYVLPMRLQNQ